MRRYLKRRGITDGTDRPKYNLMQVKEAFTKGDRAKIYGEIKHPLRDMLRNYIQSLNIKSCFEFGCNAGFNLILLQQKGIIVKGIDINKKAIEYGKRKNNLDLSVGNEKDLEKINEKFDLVFTCSVLDHIPESDFNPIVKQLERISKKYVVLLETNDELDRALFAHDYEGLGYKPITKLHSTRESGGNGGRYTLYQKEII